MIVDGRAIAEEIFSELELDRASLRPELFLGILAAGDNPVIDSYVRIKERAAKRLNVTLVRESISEDWTDEDVLQVVERLAESCDSIIVQLPLPPRIDTEKILTAIPKNKDVDGVNPSIVEKDRLVRAPIVGAIREILGRHEVAVEHKKACVVGEGRLVGAPAAAWLRGKGAEVAVISNEKGSNEELRDADIIICGAGKPGLILPGMIKEGVVLIDAGTSEAEGKIAGDADPSCAEKCSVFTPVPGGVGPIAVAMIFKNLFVLAKK